MIDQEQVRKFWAGWVRRQIGGNEMVQETAASAAVNEVLQGHDNDAAAEAARRVARSLGIDVPSSQPSVSGAPTPTPAASAAPFPGPTSAPTGTGAPSPTPADGQLRCRLCGSVPAANMTIHEHNGRVVWMVHKTTKGPFCRDCGTALLRHQQNSTLFQGWFGIFSFFITPITLLLNLSAWQKIRALAAPHRDPGTQSRLEAPLNPGKPLLRRPGPYVGGVVIAAVAVFLFVKSADTGGCLDSDRDRANRVTGLHNDYVAVFNRDAKAIEACTTLDCERAPKLEIASALNTYNAGLNQVCWPDNLKADANALIAANTATSQAFTAWAAASSDTEDQTLSSTAQQKVTDRRAADAKLADDMGVPNASSPAT